ncbi:winged helix-turn-helix transcriptional regulator [Microbispora sp. ATCC PTA-5024]|uniref:winged helix-turn-helix transcriptional regulator n=1 Tax=Microbispora sp. ATCC PTA-5024 TaxID=316330 RepID=UPI0003DC74F1|nr:helix-turn-helix domain-containing protein [Microbispora sp. ATCC PTA-5024]ETK33680.1 hypothetical protein MPTA5024_23305 [Microbispora sp. ATCC PTA-5024]
MDGDPEDPEDPEGSTAVGRALAILGDRWVLLILHRAFVLRVRTYAGFRDALSISESVLAARLKELVRTGILTHVPVRDGRTRHEYRLTGRGLALWPLLVAIYTWEARWSGRALPPLVHEVCGRAGLPYLSCGSCGRAVAARDTETLPAAAFAGAGPPRRHRRTVRADAGADAFGYLPASMEILGDRWSTNVLAAAFLGTRRFVDFQTRLGVAPSVLADRLRRFAEQDVFTAAGGDYRLTDKGLGFFPVFAFLVDWARREIAAPPGSGPAIVHRPCGAALVPVLSCPACAGPLRRKEIHYGPGRPP